MNRFNAYLIGVGGQGIGMLSEAMMRAADHAGHVVHGCDTHGLAQRGGTVVSFLRLGSDCSSPMFGRGQADLVVALERHEALRGTLDFLRPGGTLVYYDAVWQPLPVRLQEKTAVTPAELETACRGLGIRAIRVFVDGLTDARMQNVAVLATLAREKVLPGLELPHYEAALADLMTGKTLEKNLALLREAR